METLVSSPSYILLNFFHSPFLSNMTYSLMFCIQLAFLSNLTPRGRFSLDKTSLQAINLSQSIPNFSKIPASQEHQGANLFIFVLCIYCSYIPDVKLHGILVAGKHLFLPKIYTVLCILALGN